MSSGRTAPRPSGFGRVLVSLLLLASGVRLGAGMVLTMDLLPTPERPAAPVALVKGQRYPIVGYKDDKPVVRIDGAARSVVSDAVSLVPGGAFAPGLIHVKQGEGTTFSSRDFNNHVAKAQFTRFEAVLTSDTEQAAVFALCVVYEAPSGDDSRPPTFAIVGMDVGDLHPSKPVWVHTNVPPLKSSRPLWWTLVLFSSAGQVRSDRPDMNIEFLFDEVERYQWRKAMQQRLASDAPVALFRRFSLVFPEALKARYQGTTVNVSLHITDQGVLDYVESGDAQDPDLVLEVASQMRSWLFLPRVRKGNTEPSVVVLPLKF